MTSNTRISSRPGVMLSIFITAMAWSLIALGIRLFSRIKINGPLGYDDLVCGFATAAGIVQSTLLIDCVHRGLGQSLANDTKGDLQTNLQLGYAASLIYVLGAGLSRMSSCILYIRLTRRKSHLIAARVGLAVTALWTIACTFVVAFQCAPPSVWAAQTGLRCLDSYQMWEIVECIAIALEVFISAISLVIVWDLKMKLKLKVMVVSAFSVRLLNVVPLVYRISIFRSASNVSQPIYNNSDVAIITTIALHLGIISSTIPSVKQFLGVFDSGMIGALGNDQSEISRYGPNSRSRSTISGTYHLDSISNSQRTRSGKRRLESTAIDANGIRLRPEAIGQSASVIEAQQEYAASLASDDSGRAIIKKTQAWEVRHEIDDGKG